MMYTSLREGDFRMKLGEVKGKSFGTIRKPGRKLLEAVYTLDDIFLLLSLPRSWTHKLRIYQQLRTHRKLGKKGVLNGYPFMKFRFRVLNPQRTANLYTEIFVAEPYLFQTDKKRPLIIDGGVNIGASIAYFKWLYPNSRIIGFEPHPAAFEVANSNIERNGIQDVKLITAALSSVDGKANLYTVESDQQSSTLTDRLFAKGQRPQTIAINTVRLSSFINEEVDFLKLDIEGTEQSVIEEIEDHLHLVRRLFIEFHYTYGNAENRLAPLLSILDRHNFVYLVASTLYSRRNAAVGSLTNCVPVSAFNIFARNGHA